jgi:hypothetical protein
MHRFAYSGYENSEKFSAGCSAPDLPKGEGEQKKGRVGEEKGWGKRAAGEEEGDEGEGEARRWKEEGVGEGKGRGLASVPQIFNPTLAPVNSIATMTLLIGSLTVTLEGREYKTVNLDIKLRRIKLSDVISVAIIVICCNIVDSL